MPNVIFSAGNIQATLHALAYANVLPAVISGAPVDGTAGTGAGGAGKGTLLIDSTNGNLYINTGTKASPTWTAFGTVAQLGRTVLMYTAALSPAAVAANTSAEQLFTVTGVAVGDAVYVNKPSAQAGLSIAGVRVSAANQVGITFGNHTAASITPTAAETYRFGVIR